MPISPLTGAHAPYPPLARLIWTRAESARTSCRSRRGLRTRIGSAMMRGASGTDGSQNPRIAPMPYPNALWMPHESKRNIWLIYL